jgi:hypothetical protein
LLALPWCRDVSPVRALLPDVSHDHFSAGRPAGIGGFLSYKSDLQRVFKCCIWRGRWGCLRAGRGRICGWGIGVSRPAECRDYDGREKAYKPQSFHGFQTSVLSAGVRQPIRLSPRHTTDPKRPSSRKRQGVLQGATMCRQAVPVKRKMQQN